MVSEPSDGFGAWSPTGDGQGIDVTVVGPDGVTSLPIRSGGERPEPDQGLLLDNGSLYGPGTRAAAMAAARALPDEVEWTMADYHQLKSKAQRLAGPLPGEA